MPKPLQWTLAKPQHWVGGLPGCSVVQFSITRQTDGKFLLQSNVMRIPQLIFRELEHAKIIAQENFNAYAFNLFESPVNRISQT